MGEDLFDYYVFKDLGANAGEGDWPIIRREVTVAFLEDRCYVGPQPIIGQFPSVYGSLKEHAHRRSEFLRALLQDSAWNIVWACGFGRVDALEEFGDTSCRYVDVC